MNKLDSQISNYPITYAFIYGNNNIYLPVKVMERSWNLFFKKCGTPVVVIYSLAILLYDMVTVHVDL